MRKQPATREFVSGRLSDMASALRDGHLAVRKATAEVSFEDDPNVLGRRAYRITGHSKGAVQAAVTCRMQALDFADGFGHFVGPYRDGDGFMAVGEIIITPTPEEAIRSAALLRWTP
jgi:hypothetical protein